MESGGSLRLAAALCPCQAAPSCRGSSTGWQRPTRVPSCWWSLSPSFSSSCSHSEQQQSTQPCGLARARGGRTWSSQTQRGGHGSQQVKAGSGALPERVLYSLPSSRPTKPRPSKASTTGELSTELSEGLRLLSLRPQPPPSLQGGAGAGAAAGQGQQGEVHPRGGSLLGVREWVEGNSLKLRPSSLITRCVASYRAIGL